MTDVSKVPRGEKTAPRITPQVIRDVAEREDDFGFEMRVGKIIRIGNDGWEHGGTYIDPFGGVPRQFDYRTVFKHEDQWIRLAVECKNLSPNIPLVVCGAKRRTE